MPTSRGAPVSEQRDNRALAKQRLLEMGKRIRFARESAAMSRMTLAVALSHTPMSVYRYETGKRVPSFEQLEDIAFLTGFACDWLLTGKGPMRAGAAA